MIRSYLTAALALGLAGLAVSTAAAEKPSGWRPAASVDVLAPGNAVKHAGSTRDALCNALAAQGIGCTGTTSNYVSVGGRVGFYDYADENRFGASLGILSGGPNRQKAVINALPPVPGTATLNNRSTTFRGVLEAGRRLPLSDDWELSLGAGIGMALTNESLNCSGSGSLAASCAGVGGTTNWGWATWELTPAVLYHGMEVGLRYVGMARGKQNPWNTWGGEVGYRF